MSYSISLDKLDGRPGSASVVKQLKAKIAELPDGLGKDEAKLSTHAILEAISVLGGNVAADGKDLTASISGHGTQVDGKTTHLSVSVAVFHSPETA